MGGQYSLFVHLVNDRPKEQMDAPQLRTRPDATVRNVDNMIWPDGRQTCWPDINCKEIEIRGEKLVQVGDGKRIWSHWNNTWNGSKRCPENPEKDKKSKNCGRLGSLEDNC